LIERVERQRDVYLALQETLDDSDTLKFKPPKIASKNLRDAAAITREWLNLSEANDFATYRRAVEAKGVLVFRSNGYNGAWQIPKEEPICGFTVYTPTCPVIVVKKMAVEARQVFTLMHELAHILLHRESFIDEADDLYSHQGREREANEFAGLLLVTDDVLRNVDDRARPDHVSQFDAWVRIVTHQLGISPEVVLLRLLDVGRLDRADYDSYREWRSKQRIPADASGAY
jgi:Zn-dependent peptidase ImmA (M78 family)